MSIILIALMNYECQMEARMKQARKDQVLKCIVDEFIKTGEPVGSKTLIEKYCLDCSSATIRNTMADLEKDGMIEKTHVSSGRVPSAKAYQYYLDHLDSQSLANSVDMDFQREFQQILSDKNKSVEDVIAKSCEMLSEMTKMATVVLGPKADAECLVSIQLLRLTENTAMGILITDGGHVEKKTFVIPENANVSFQTISETVKTLNDRLTGTKISELETKAKALAPLIGRMFGKEGSLVMEAFLETVLNFARKRFKVFGQRNLLSLPEFQEDKNAFINAMSALEDPNRLEHDLSHQDDLGFVNVGFTNDQKGDFAIVSKPIDRKEGSIAIVGPKRMDYKKILSALEYVAYMLDRYFTASDGSKALVPVSQPTTVDSKTKPKAKSKTKKGVKA